MNQYASAARSARRRSARESAEQAFADILDAQGRARTRSPTSSIALSERGETSIEIAAAARALRERLIPIDAPAGAIDVCGTGGDGASHAQRLDRGARWWSRRAACRSPSTATAPPRPRRARPTRSRRSGLDLDRAGATAEATLADLGIAFLFAANHHPAMKRITPIRRRIGRRTIFNLMGPLANPAHVTRQLIGIARPDYAEPYAEALEQLGTEAALVVSGEEGLDELSCAGATPAGAASASCAWSDRITPGGCRPPDAIRSRRDPRRRRAVQRRRAAPPAAGRARRLSRRRAAQRRRRADRRRRMPTAGSEGVEEAAEAIDKGLANALLDCWIAYQ